MYSYTKIWVRKHGDWNTALGKQIQSLNQYAIISDNGSVPDLVKKKKKKNEIIQGSKYSK